MSNVGVLVLRFRVRAHKEQNNSHDPDSMKPNQARVESNVLKQCPSTDPSEEQLWRMAPGRNAGEAPMSAGFLPSNSDQRSQAVLLEMGTCETLGQSTGHKHLGDFPCTIAFPVFATTTGERNQVVTTGARARSGLRKTTKRIGGIISHE